MASSNAGALLTGMTDGVVNMWKFGLQQQRYDREDERQAKRDAREDKESGIRTEAAQLTLDKARQERDTQRYLREVGQRYMSGEDVPDFDAWSANQTAASKPVTPVASAAAAAAPKVPSAELPPLKPAAVASATASSAPATSKPGSVPNPFDVAMPSVASQAAPAMPPATAQQANQPAPSVSIGDVIAAKGVKQQRSEDDLIKWRANVYRAQGLHDKANELETKWLDVTEKRQAREKALLLEKTLAGINQIGGDYVVQNLAPLFGKDVELRHEPDGNGGGVITAYKASDPTKPIGTQRYKDKSDLYDMTEQYVDPTGYAKRVAEARVAALKHQRALQVAAARSGASYDANGDVVGRVDEFTARGRGGNGGNSGGDGTGTRGTKPPKTPADRVDEIHEEIAKSLKADLTVDQITSSKVASRRALEMNPGVDPAAAVDAGFRFAQAEAIRLGNKSNKDGKVDPTGLSIRWDANTMTAIEGVDTPGGWVGVNRITHRNALNRDMPPEKIRAAVESSIQQLTGGDPAQRQRVIAAAFDKTGQARRALLEQAKTELKAMPEFKKLPPQVQVQKLAEHERIVNDMLTTPLGWIANFGQELNK